MHPAIDLWIEADARKDREAAKAAMRAVLEDSQASAEASRFLPHHREALAEAIHDASAPPEPLRPALAPTRPFETAILAPGSLPPPETGNRPADRSDR